LDERHRVGVDPLLNLAPVRRKLQKYVQGLGVRVAGFMVFTARGGGMFKILS